MLHDVSEGCSVGWNSHHHNEKRTEKTLWAQRSSNNRNTISHACTIIKKSCFLAVIFQSPNIKLSIPKKETIIEFDQVWCLTMCLKVHESPVRKHPLQ